MKTQTQTSPTGLVYRKGHYTIIVEPFTDDRSVQLKYNVVLFSHGVRTRHNIVCGDYYLTNTINRLRAVVRSKEQERAYLARYATIQQRLAAIERGTYCSECGAQMTFEFTDGSADNNADIYHCGDCDNRTWR